jgi:t-SNARE complex subunit (syntaxin)
MRNFQSTTEGTWIELLPVQLTEEQKTLMISTNKENEEAKQTLMETIRAQRESIVSSEKQEQLNSFYNLIKPEVGENDVYDFVSANLSKKESKISGILNFRVNGEHKQIRF